MVKTTWEIVEAKLLSNRLILSNGCWIYDGCSSGNNYKQLRINNKLILVHRVAAKLWLPNFSEILKVCHSCDNTSCFNPFHLFMGTQSDNIKDAVVKGRHFYASQTHCLRGHEFSVANTIRTAVGRWCRACAEIRYLKRKALAR